MVTGQPTKTCAILQSCYIPWKGYFDIIQSVDEFVLYDCVQYTKNDWRNRNLIKTANGLQWITIPVSVKDRLNTRIDEVNVANDTWRRQHWRALSESYSRTRFFAKYKDLFENFYLEGTETNLSALNARLTRLICSILGITTRIRSSEEFSLGEDRNVRLVQICQQVNANQYLSGAAAKAYLNLSLFENNSINVVWADYSNYPEYEQRFPPFSHGVTILDLIFNEGPNARDFMRSVSASLMLPAQTQLATGAELSI